LVDAHPKILAEVRGQGLMLGLRTHVPNTDFTVAARGENMLVIPAGDNVVRLLPPLIAGEAEFDEAITRLEKACQRLEADLAKNG
jgi:acetylornithine/N-succinyldiaminopimelate aminotransferase